MNKITTRLQLVTPCISSGADQKIAELRAQSLRGMLHFWFRSLGGKLDQEQRIFGRIGKQEQIRRSSLNVRILLPDQLRTSVKDCQALTGSAFDYFLWPLRDQRHTPGSGNRGIVAAGEKFELILSHQRIKDGACLPPNVVKTAALLGSLGTRSRRCYGSLWPLSFNDDENEMPKTMDDLSTLLQSLLEGKNIQVRDWGKEHSWKDAVALAANKMKQMRCGSSKSGTPSKWGQNDHDVPLNRGDTVYRQALGLPLAQRYSNGRDKWQSFISGEDRWGSPLHLKIAPLSGGYHVIAVYLNDYVLPEGQKVELKSRRNRLSPALSLDLWNEMKCIGTALA